MVAAWEIYVLEAVIAGAALRSDLSRVGSVGAGVEESGGLGRAWCVCESFRRGRRRVFGI